MGHSFYNSYYEINLRTIKENINKIKAFHPDTDIITVLKADAYGMGTGMMARYLTKECGINTFAVAQVCEGLKIRAEDINCPVLVLGPIPEEAVPYAIANDLMTPLFTKEQALILQREAEKQNTVAKAQIKIETGMNRIGVRPGYDLEALLNCLDDCPNIKTVGVYSHFAQADIKDDPFTMEQFEKFKRGVKQIEKRDFPLEYIHICNTSATEWFKEAVAFSTHVRVASLFLGYSDISNNSNPMDIKEALSWRASITAIHTVKKGETAGYGRFFKAEKDTEIAIAGVGFADGLYGYGAKHHCPVLVNDTFTHYLDTCMDQCFIDVTGIKCKVGDPVTIFGYSPGGVLLSPKTFSYFGQAYTTYTSVGGLRSGKIYIE